MARSKNDDGTDVTDEQSQPDATPEVLPIQHVDENSLEDNVWKYLHEAESVLEQLRTGGSHGATALDRVRRVLDLLYPPEHTLDETEPLPPVAS